MTMKVYLTNYNKTKNNFSNSFNNINESCNKTKNEKLIYINVFK